MEKELYEILLGGGAIGLFYIVYLIVRVIFGKGNGNYQKKTADAVNLIESNHLNDILGAIKEQTKASSDDHKEQIKVLTEIKTILQERK